MGNNQNKPAKTYSYSTIVIGYETLFCAICKIEAQYFIDYSYELNCDWYGVFTSGIPICGQKCFDAWLLSQ